jgi:hypothetical protein
MDSVKGAGFLDWAIIKTRTPGNAGICWKWRKRRQEESKIQKWKLRKEEQRKSVGSDAAYGVPLEPPLPDPVTLQLGEYGTLVYRDDISEWVSIPFFVPFCARVSLVSCRSNSLSSGDVDCERQHVLWNGRV